MLLQMTRTVYGDVVDTWLKYGKNYQTVLFAPDVETSKSTLSYSNKGVSLQKALTLQCPLKTLQMS